MKTVLFSSLLAVTILFSSLISYAEQTKIVLNRTSTNGLKLEGSLEKDIYKSVPYKANYEEQEAYQAEEEYTVDIPYQTQETYYEDVPYQDTETYWENVPYEDRESYQDTEYYYDSEYQCRTVTEYERVCRDERLCAPRPGEQVCQMVEECGTNAHGERICKTRKVCENGPSREDCSTRQVCNNEPRQQQKCGYEQVKKSRLVTKYRNVTRYRQEQRTRTVTKYRQEARTRTVTKYRQETRTRTVTRYRTVTKCCVTKYREEFDHTWKLNLQVVLPAQATLQAQEVERFQVALSGDENRPDVDFQVLESIFGYKIARKDIKASSGLIELALAPKYNQANLGEKLLEKVELAGNGEVLNELLIHDKGNKPRVTTQYRFRILEKDTARVASEGEVTSAKAQNGVIEVQLQEGLSADVDYAVQISATRNGIVLEKSFSFTVTKEIKFQRWNSEDFGNKTLKNAVLNEQKDKTLIEFSDEGAHAKLNTVYKVKVLTHKSEEIWSSEFKSQNVLDAQKKAKIEIPSSALQKEEDLNIVLEVNRTSKRLDKTVQFQVQLAKSFVRTEDLKDKAKVKSVKLIGSSNGIRFVMTDDLRKSNSVKSEYRLIVLRHGGFLGTEKKVLADIKLDDTGLQNGKMDVSLFSLGVRAKDLQNHASSGSTLYIDLTVTRKLVNSNTTAGTFKKYATITVQ